MFSSRTREVPPWGKEHAVAWADPWEDLSHLSFSELVGILNLCLLDFARGRKDLEMSYVRRAADEGQNGPLERLAAARQLAERIREAPGYYDVSPADLEAYRTERSDGLATGACDLELVRVPGDSQSRPFVSAVCVAILGMHPLETPELISNVDQRGPQVVVQRLTHPDAENLNNALERFGFTMNIRQRPAGAADRETAPPQKAIAADIRREAARRDGG